MNSYRSRCRNRVGFTVVELLVVIGIIGVLIGLTIPAVQASREAARRAQCVANLGQLILAAHSFEAANGGFPGASFWGIPNIPRDPGTYGVFSLHSRLLPFLEQGDLFDGINFELPTGGVGGVETLHATAASRVVAAFLCPSDPQSMRGGPLTPVSYRASTGLAERERLANGMTGVRNEGAFVRNNRPGTYLPLSSIGDGLSATLAFSEKPIGSGAGGAYSPFRDWADSCSGPGNPRLTADQWIEACSNLGEIVPRADAGATWMLHGAIYTEFFVSAPPNAVVPDCGCQTPAYGVGLFSARSYHPGGVNAAMADGSVRWFSSAISTTAWRSLGTRAGGEVTPD